MFDNILISVDLNEDEERAHIIDAIKKLEITADTTVHIMTVIPDFGTSLVGTFFPADYEKKAMNEAGTRLHAFTDTLDLGTQRIQHHVSHGTVYDEILGVAKEIKADLIVIGAHSPRLQDYLLGPNAARVMRHARCSVLVVR